MDNAASYVRRTRLFEFYARFLWPIHRLFVSKYLARRCKKCIISETCSPLGDNGLCSECASGKVIKQEENVSQEIVDEMEQVLASFQQKGKGAYDALALFSGGKDSSFLLYNLKTKFPKLRVLAFTVDHGFLSPVAKQNIKNVVKKLNVDHIIYTPQGTVFQKLYRYALTHVGNKGTYAVVDRLDGSLVHCMARNYAASHKIPLMLTGISSAQVKHILGLDSYEIPREMELGEQDFEDLIDINEVFATEEIHNWWNPLRYNQNDIARVIMPLSVWRYDEQEIRQKVVELGLIEKGNDSPLVTNNLTIMLMGLVDIITLGYSSFEPEFATLVREGKTDPKVWKNIFELLEYSGKTGFLIAKEINKLLDQLKLTQEELNIELKTNKIAPTIPISISPVQTVSMRPTHLQQPKNDTISEAGLLN